MRVAAGTEPVGAEGLPGCSCAVWAFGPVHILLVDIGGKQSEACRCCGSKPGNVVAGRRHSGNSAGGGAARGLPREGGISGVRDSCLHNTAH